MKILIFSFLATSAYYMSYLHYGIEAQSIFINAMPNRTFKYMRPEWLNRGGFNISQCLRELLNCWEDVRGDVVCSNARHRQTVCEHMKEDCHDYYGYIDKHYYEFSMIESMCVDNNFQQYTRKKSP